MAGVPETARAAVLLATGQPLEIRDIQVPDRLEHGSILVKTVASVCASDVHDWLGDRRDLSRLKFPRTLGHEMEGTRDHLRRVTRKDPEHSTFSGDAMDTQTNLTNVCLPSPHLDSHST